MCRAEGPAVEQFARQNADTLSVVGLGTQDSLDMARDFIDLTGTVSFPMYWDDSFESWNFYGITGQPAAILVSENGEPIAAWRGRFPEDEVIDLARENA